jgi:hypothetical protein
LSSGKRLDQKQQDEQPDSPMHLSKEQMVGSERGFEQIAQ